VRRFLTRAGGFLAIQLLVGTALLGPYLRTGDPSVAYLAAYRDKSELLERTEGAKLVLVGGSNVALGFDSEALSAALPYEPVNAGLMVGIGLPMMLEQVEPHLRPGDVVLLSPEYDQWAGGFDPFAVLRLLEDDPGAWRDIPVRYLPPLLDDSLSYLGQGLRAMLGRGGRPRTLPPPYSRDGFNRFGDFVRHRDLPGEEELRGPLVVPHVDDGSLRDAVTTLNDFQHGVEQRGITVLLSFPPLPRDVYESREEDFQALYRYLREELRIPLLDSPEEMALPRDLFYDTIYHLNRAGLEQRTRDVIARIEDALGGA